jgi:Arc/MetJ-type ribon-helix-helix transcriptional regulator
MIYYIMKRTQIQLTEEQHRQLQRWARDRGISLSEAIRRCVSDRLAAERTAPTRAERVRAVLALAGKYRDPSELTDVAREHDAHLVDAYRR